jgi:hypothetical protein
LTDAAIASQLEKILANRLFSGSQRYPAFLRFVVEKTLEGEGGTLRERLIGNAVFNRAANYDTNADPVVRITAAEVRRRLAQYYHEPQTASEIRIGMRNGSYVPSFDPPSSIAARPIKQAVLPEPEPILVGIKQDTAAGEATGPRKLSWLAVIAGILAALLLIFLAFTWLGRQQRHTASLSSQTWQSIKSSDMPPLICLGVPSTIIEERTSNDPNFADWIERMNTVSFDDVIAQDKIIHSLQQNGIEHLLGNSAQVDFGQLRSRPTILIGILDNRWSMKAIEKLRYRMLVAPGTKAVVEVIDTQNVATTPWTLNGDQTLEKIVNDYAIVARFTDTVTGQPTWILGGMGSSGTIAASEFVTDDEQMHALFASAPAGWQNGNFEIVLQTEVVSGVAAKPKLLAKTFW